MASIQALCRLRSDLLTHNPLSQENTYLIVTMLLGPSLASVHSGFI